ncbi:DUF1178 family protein [Rhodocyclaceae bacterium SMB388]
MIVLNLSCDEEHLFEGWFASASAFEDQCAQRQVECPVCGSTDIARRPTAPYVKTGVATGADDRTKAPSGAKPQISADAVATAISMLRIAAKKSEDVGERFAEEARRIHYGETDARSIKGKASPDDVGEMLEEGILVLPVPPDESDLH